MQVARAASNVPPTSAPIDGTVRNVAASYAPLYLASTLGNMSFDIEELEGIALDRLKVLKAAETARSSSTIAPGPAKMESIRTAVRAAERTHGLSIPPHTNPDRESRILKDQASHFLLRLALCSTQEHRSWLLATECDLFSTRLDGTGVAFALRAIEKAHGPVVLQATASDLDAVRSELDAVARGPNKQKGDSGTRYYKVPFEEVPALLRHRRVFLHRGTAFVPERNVLDIVAMQFRAKLSLGLMTAARATALAENDSRMGPILVSIRQHLAAEGDEKKSFLVAPAVDKIHLNQLNDSMPAMPLCMWNMMSKLREQHHLRHAARLQLGVFLKGCGLTMDESQMFWKTEFGKGDISADKFEKNYAYNIRHQYGKEGKRRNLQPFPCMRIINERPGPGEHNGCPYREFQDVRLRQSLRALGTDPNAIDAVVAKAKEGNFQVACGMCFTATQPGRHEFSEHGLPEYIPNHPNDYFIEARRRRLGPIEEEAQLDEELDENEMIAAAEAAENLTSQEKSQEGNVSDGGADAGENKPVTVAAGKATAGNTDKAVASNAERAAAGDADMATAGDADMAAIGDAEKSATGTTHKSVTRAAEQSATGGAKQSEPGGSKHRAEPGGGGDSTETADIEAGADMMDIDAPTAEAPDAAAVAENATG